MTQPRSDETPAGLIRLSTGILVPRRAGFVDAAERPECPHGHEITVDPRMIEGTAVRYCHWRMSHHDRECGAPYLVLKTIAGPYMADLMEDEARRIEQQELRSSEVVRLLGLKFAPRRAA